MKKCLNGVLGSRMFGSLATAVASASISLLATTAAFATNFSFDGTFTRDDDVQLFSFTADGSSTVRLISYSYGGGTQANGTVVPAGGFDPILALFDSSGNLVGQDDDAVSGTPGACGSGVVNPDPITNNQWDTCLDLALSAGNYEVAIMQYNNFANGPTLADGFSASGSNFTGALGGCSNGQFCDVSGNPAGNNRTNAWAFDILNVSTAVEEGVPEPATLGLIGLGLAGLGFVRRRRAAA